MTYYLVLDKITFGKVTFVVVRNNADGSPINDGGKTPCRSFFYSETLGM